MVKACYSSLITYLSDKSISLSKSSSNAACRSEIRLNANLRSA